MCVRVSFVGTYVPFRYQLITVTTFLTQHTPFICKIWPESGLSSNVMGAYPLPAPLLLPERKPMCALSGALRTDVTWNQTAVAGASQSATAPFTRFTNPSLLIQSPRTTGPVLQQAIVPPTAACSPAWRRNHHACCTAVSLSAARAFNHAHSTSLAPRSWTIHTPKNPLKRTHPCPIQESWTTTRLHAATCTHETQIQIQIQGDTSCLSPHQQHPVHGALCHLVHVHLPLGRHAHRVRLQPPRPPPLPLERRPV